MKYLIILVLLCSGCTHVRPLFKCNGDPATPVQCKCSDCKCIKCPECSVR